MGVGRGANSHAFGLVARDLEPDTEIFQLKALFQSEQFARALLQRLGACEVRDGDAPPAAQHPLSCEPYHSLCHLHIDLPGYEIPPHPDDPSKLITYQFFLTDPPSTTRRTRCCSGPSGLAAGSWHGPS